MKKLFLSSVVLFAFAISMFLFQFSCKKDVSATTSSSPSLGIILYAVGNDGNGANGAASSYWIMNNDGTNQKQIPITFSANRQYTMFPKLSPDGKTIFFSSNTAYVPMNSILYSCSLDGSNLKTLLTAPQVGGAGADIEVAGAY